MSDVSKLIVPRHFQFHTEIGGVRTGILYTAEYSTTASQWRLTWVNRGVQQESFSPVGEIRMNLESGFWVMVNKPEDMFIELGD